MTRSLTLLGTAHGEKSGTASIDEDPYIRDEAKSTTFLPFEIRISIEKMKVSQDFWKRGFDASLMYLAY